MIERREASGEVLAPDLIERPPGIVPPTERILKNVAQAGVTVNERAAQAGLRIVEKTEERC